MGADNTDIGTTTGGSTDSETKLYVDYTGLSVLISLIKQSLGGKVSLNDANVMGDASSLQVNVLKDSAGKTYPTVSELNEYFKGKNSSYVFTKAELQNKTAYSYRLDGSKDVDDEENAVIDLDTESIEIHQDISLTDISGNSVKVSDLTIGDAIYLTDTNVPDFFFAGDSQENVGYKVLYRLETSKFNSDTYLTKTETEQKINAVNEKSDANAEDIATIQGAYLNKANTIPESTIKSLFGSYTERKITLTFQRNYDASGTIGDVVDVQFSTNGGIDWTSVQEPTSITSKSMETYGGQIKLRYRYHPSLIGASQKISFTMSCSTISLSVSGSENYSSTTSTAWTETANYALGSDIAITMAAILVEA